MLEKLTGVHCLTEMKFTNAAVRTMALVAAMRATSVQGFGSSTRTPMIRRVATSSTWLQAAKKDQSFPTWSFDKPCTSIEWNELAPVDLSITSEKNYQESDLVMVGVFAPTTEEEDDDEATEEKSTPIELSGLAKEIDDSLGGALKELMEENSKAFKGGAQAGSTTPTLRVRGADGKVGTC